MIITSALWVPRLLLAILAFSSVLYGQDLPPKKKPQGPLGVTLDYSLATTWKPEANSKLKYNVMWSSHITFASPVSSITDNQLWELAGKAFLEVTDDMKQYNLPAVYRPGAMTVLAFGNEIIFASSQKGKPSFTYGYENTLVLESLKLCEAVWRNDGPGDDNPENDKNRHTNKGSCGEVMAAHLYYSIHTPPLATQNARVATVVGKPNKFSPRDPCGYDNAQEPDWGCNLFVTEQKLKPLDITLAPATYTLSTLAGGPSVVDQIQLCSVLKQSSS